MTFFIKVLILFYIQYMVKAEYVRVWGPGLKPDVFVMPARYFFIDVHNNSVPDSGKSLKVTIDGENSYGRPCRVWLQTLDRKDGSFIVRYKLYESCKNLEISVKIHDQHVAESPYETLNFVYAEECDCQKRNIDEWLEKWQCSYPDQIKRDLDKFGDIDWNFIREQIIKDYDNPGGISLCHYVIKSNQIYRNCYGKYVGFKMFMDNMLLSITRKVSLPDLEFFVNLGDWPLVKDKPKYPIFSWCGSTNTFDIVMPTYDISESTLENMGGVTLDMLSVQGNAKHSWPNRIPKAFWRGRDSSMERLKLVNISRSHPELFNVSMTNFFFYRDQVDLYGPKENHASFFDFFDYKYQINIDGTVAAYRFPYLLAGGSLILKQQSTYYEHFYNELVPGLHYVEIRRDLEDLVEKLSWAKDNDHEALEIALAGQQFAINNLLPVHIYCYYVRLFSEFHKKIKNNIVVHPGMEQVKFTKKTLECKCLHDNVKDEL